MRQTQTALLERGALLGSGLQTEPFEVAWAGEARWFVHFLTDAPGATVSLQTQISADGLLWVDHESAAVHADAQGIITFSVHDFGHWLRLDVRRDPAGTGSGAADPRTADADAASDQARVRIYLALKE